jgi:hypothetical protein
MTLILNGTDGLSDVDGTAATPAIRGTDTNTGIFFPAADTIAFSTGGAEAMRVTSAGLLQFNSGYGSVATGFGCRSWVNFDGTGAVAIRGSGNISSITDNATGNYTVNFSTAMPDVNYSAVASIRNNPGVASGAENIIAMNTGSVQITAEQTNNFTSYDPSFVCVSVFR